jgi:hypothetical protein
MLISLPSIRNAAAGAVGAGALTGAMLFGAVPLAQAAEVPAVTPTVAVADTPDGAVGVSDATRVDLRNPADLGRVVPMDDDWWGNDDDQGWGPGWWPGWHGWHGDWPGWHGGEWHGWWHGGWHGGH